MRRLALLVLALAAIGAAPADAQTSFALELQGPASAEYGARVVLRGAIRPALAGATVTISRDGAPIGSTTTRADGTFAFRTTAVAPATYEARSDELASGPVVLSVLPRVRIRFVGRSVVGAPLRVEVRVDPVARFRVVVRRNGRVIIDRNYVGRARIPLRSRTASRFQVRVIPDTPPGWPKT